MENRKLIGYTVSKEMKSKNTKRYFLVFMFFGLLCFSMFLTFPENSQAATTINKPPYLLYLTSGLVSHWTMDGKDTVWTSATAATTVDKSGNSNTGTLTNMAQATSPVLGKIGQGLVFDGVDDNVLISSTVSTFNQGAGSYSVSAWIKMNNTSTCPQGADGCAIISSLGNSGNGSQGDFFFAVDGSGELRFNNWKSSGADLTGGNRTDSDPITTGVWFHVVGTFNGTTTNLYINSTQQATVVGTTGSGNTVGTRLGTFYTGSSTYFFNGVMDDVRIYNRVLSSTEITQLYNFGAAKQNLTVAPTALTSGLLGHWTFDGKNTPWTSSTAATALDSSGNNETGTLTNMAQATSPVPGKIGQGLNFDGTNDYIQTSSALNFGGSSIATLSFWMNKPSYANDDDLAFELSTNANSNDGAFFVNINSSAPSNGKVALLLQHGGKRQESFTRPSAGSWHHYAIIYDDSTALGDITAYVDGVLQSTTIDIDNKTTVGDILDDTLYFMNRAGSSLFNQGTLDDVHVYNRALTSTEVTQLYNLGR